MRYPEELLKLIAWLRKLPGVGTKTAERYAFHLLGWSDEKLFELGLTLQELKKQLTFCNECGALIDSAPCSFCALDYQENPVLCVVESARDVFAIDETREYQGFYHVLGGLLSPLSEKPLNEAQIAKLKKRIKHLQIKEVIIALDSTVEGDATALYLKRELNELPIHISRLAMGLPIGSSLEIIDGGTLGRALAFRRQY